MIGKMTNPTLQYYILVLLDFVCYQRIFIIFPGRFSGSQYFLILVMDLTILQAFVTLPFILLVICIGILTEFFKKTLPKIAKKIAPNTPDRLDNIVSFIWSELILPFLPIFIGIAIGIYIDDMMIPDVISQKMRVMYFAFAGFLSSHCYDRIKKFVKKEGE